MSRVQLQKIFALVALCIAPALSGCGSNDGTRPRVPALIVIASASGTTTVAGTIQFSATVKDADGNALSVTPTWSVVNGGGTITTTGLFTAGDSIGTFTNTVVATSGSVTSSSTVVVGAGALATITVTPATDSVNIGATQQFVAVGRDSHGNVVDIPNRVWSVAHAGGSIDTAGVFTADTVAGTFANTVTATSGSVSGAASVTVRPDAVERIQIHPDTATLAIGGHHTFIATGYDTYNNPVAVTPSWHVSGGGTIDTAGVFTADTVAGNFPNTVFARLGNMCGDPYAFASVMVLPGPLATITVSPANPGVMAGGTLHFTATGADTYGNPIAITPSWSVIGTGGGTIDASTGVYTAGFAPGTYTNSVAAFVNSLVGVTSVQIFFPIPPTLKPPPPPIVINPSY